MEPPEPPRTPDAAPKAPKKSALIEWGKTLALVVILFLIIRAFVVEAYVVSGDSMEGTLHDGERLLVSKFSVALGRLDRGDIIVFEDAHDGRRIIKRVVGLPGESVEIRGGEVYVDGRLLDESYIDPANNRDNFSTLRPVQIPEGHYFVLGDNRDNSRDSRRPDVGPIAEDRIVGEAIFLFFPLGHIRTLTH